MAVIAMTREMGSLGKDVALGLADEVGSIEVGKAGDLVALAGDRPEFWAGPAADPHDVVAFGASRAAVRHVFVGGEPRVEDGELTGLDLDAIRAGAERTLADVVRRSGLDLAG